MSPKHPLLVRPFALIALAVAVVGSTLGAVLLLRIHLALGVVEPFWVQVHGQAQVFGFIVPLVLGFGTYLVPRVAGGQPIRSAFAPPALLALLFAAVATLVAPFGGGLVLRRALAVLVAAGSICGVIALEAPLGASRRDGGRRSHEPLLEAALVFLALGALADAAAWWLSAGGHLPEPLASAAWRLALEGFAVGMALAISARMFSGFLGIAPAMSFSPVNRASARRERTFRGATAIWAISVLTGAAGAMVGSDLTQDVADILFAAGVIPLSLQLGLARTAEGPAIDRTRDPLFPFGARAAYALLVVGAAVGAVSGTADLARLPVHSLWRDARRHLINIGFLLTLIATMAGRLAPGYARRPLAWPALRLFAIVGFALSAVLRALEGVAGQWGPSELLWASAISGPLAAVALVALAASLGATLVQAR
jgi:hypothetical protein